MQAGQLRRTLRGSTPEALSHTRGYSPASRCYCRANGLPKPRGLPKETDCASNASASTSSAASPSPPNPAGPRPFDRKTPSCRDRGGTRRSSRAGNRGSRDCRSSGTPAASPAAWNASTCSRDLAWKQRWRLVVGGSRSTTFQAPFSLIVSLPRATDCCAARAVEVSSRNLSLVVLEHAREARREAHRHCGRSARFSLSPRTAREGTGRSVYASRRRR
jgi:hypothetical protein